MFNLDPEGVETPAVEETPAEVVEETPTETEQGFKEKNYWILPNNKANVVLIGLGIANPVILSPPPLVSYVQVNS